MSLDIKYNINLIAQQPVPYFNDFLWENSQNCVNAIAGLNSSISQVAATSSDPGGHPGILTLVTGTSSSGRAGIVYSSAANAIRLGHGLVRTETLITLENLSDGSDSFVVRSGYNNDPTTDGTDAVMFRYTHSANGGRWQAVTRNNGVENSIDTGIAVVAGDWYKLRIVINAVANVVLFYINGVLVATENGPTIPANRTTAPMIAINKTLGTTTRRLMVDYVYSQVLLTTLR